MRDDIKSTIGKRPEYEVMKTVYTVHLFEPSSQFAYTGAYADANLFQLVGVRRIYPTIYNGTCAGRA